MAEEDLESLLNNPFRGRSRAQAAVEEEAAAFVSEPTAQVLHDYHGFRQSLDVFLRPHASSAAAILERLFEDRQTDAIRQVLEEHEKKPRRNLEEIQRSYRIYIDTSGDETLEKEAKRLERRYFPAGASTRQLQFIKFKRYYEKLKTFNEIAKREWREVHKIMDTYTLIVETRGMASSIEREFLRSTQVLLRQTDSFLDSLRLYMRVTEETLDQVTGAYRITLSYDEKIRYTVGAFLGDREAEPEVRAPAVEPEKSGPFETEEEHSSIARSIILETRERKLNRHSIFSVPILGSRDWNRTPWYSMEVPMRFYDQAVQNFRKAYHVNVDPDGIQGPVAPAAAVHREGFGESVLDKYIALINGHLEEIAMCIIMEDFPGLDLPLVFLYHCGPNVVYEILKMTLKREGLGEIIFLDEAHTNVRELPEELIQKLLIDWWQKKMSAASGEQIDSYLSFSRGLEMVKKDFRVLYEEGAQRYKVERPGAAYFGQEKWIREHKYEIFGLRKVVIFKRFIPGTLLEG